MVEQAARQAERYVGAFHAELIGLSFYKVEVAPSELVRLVREPGNEKDPNAIRVDNESGKKVGYIAPRTAAWLSPLLDRGMIRVEPRVSSQYVRSDPDQREQAPLSLRVFVLAKGRAIFERKQGDPAGESAVHNAVLQEYADAAAGLPPARIDENARRLRELMRGRAPAETHLLVALYAGHALRARRRVVRREMDAVRAFLSRLRIGNPVTHKYLTMYPLLDGGQAKPGCVLLGDGVESGQTRIEEVDEQGQIPRLRVRHEGVLPLLIVEGDILVGGKQNRVTNVSMVLPEHSETFVPVTCVEKGRWTNRDRYFCPSFAAPPSLRAQKTRSILRSAPEHAPLDSDQEQVWDSVDSVAALLEVQSHTDSITDSYQASEIRLDEYRRRMPLPPDAVGIVMGLDNRVLGLDIFDSAYSLQSYWPRLSDSYFLEGLLRETEAYREAVGGEETSPPPSHDNIGREQVEAVMARLVAKVRPARGRPGVGLGIDLDDGDLVGSGVWYDGAVRHLSAFQMAPTA